MAKKVQNRTNETKASVAEPQPTKKLFYVWIGILLFLAYLMVYNNSNAEDGEIVDDTKTAPQLELMSWLDGVYQKKTDVYLKEYSPIGKDLLPIKNQIDFDVFDKYNIEDYVKGKTGCILTSDLINAYWGRDYKGDSVIAEKIKQIKTVADTLRAKNIQLVLLFAPTKEQLMPELIKDKYLKYEKKKNNYSAYVEGCKKNGINHIDLEPFMQQLRKKYSYPIYPPYGTHPSYFTECMVADTVIKYLEQILHINLPHITWSKVDYPAKPKFRDADAIGKARLKYPPESTPMAYPAINYAATSDARKIRVLGIGDSYYRSFMYLGVDHYVFYNSEYWYYYNSVIPETPDKKEVWEYDLKSKIESHDVVMIYYSNFRNYGGGFFEDAYELYTDPTAYYQRVGKEKNLKGKIKLIHQNPDLLEEAEHESAQLNVPLDSAIRLKAINMLGVSQ